ncbi:MAG: hypothetical protein ACYC5J_08805 [Chloroflexota bacterium]
MVKEAAAIYQGQDREETAKWQAQETEAVATLLRDFDNTTAYVKVAAAAAARGEPWDVRYSRTTGALERLNRTLHWMVRQVVLFLSDFALEVRAYLIQPDIGEMLIAQSDHGLEVVEEQLELMPVLLAASQGDCLWKCGRLCGPTHISTSSTSATTMKTSSGSCTSQGIHTPELTQEKAVLPDCPRPKAYAYSCRSIGLAI